MTTSKTITVSVLAWFCVGLFWLVATSGFHPTWTLAVVVTCALVVAYAAATYVNHLYLIPKYLRVGRIGAYIAYLVLAMTGLTAIALAIIKISYLYIFGPYPVNYWYIDFAIDFFGMLVHLVLALVTVTLFKRFAH